MKRQLLTIGATGAIIASAAACVAPPPVIGQPGYCGQTADGKALVALAVDMGSCTPQSPGQLRIVVDEVCGPIMPGSNAVDDCWQGNIPGVRGFGIFRYGSITGSGGTAAAFVASDATAA